MGGLSVRAAGLDDVMASKEWADRPKDYDALPELRQLHRAASMFVALTRLSCATMVAPSR